MADPVYSRVHRIAAGDRVIWTHADDADDAFHDDVTTADIGTVTGFANDERTYVTVTFDNGAEKTLTEDELHRLPPEA